MKFSLVGLIWVVAGLLVLIFPHLINWFIGIGVIIIGILHFRK